MTKKQVLHHILMGCAMVAALTACSNIDENERLIPVEGGGVPADTVSVDQTLADSLYDAPVSTVPRRVLIEDHTGQECPNCPDATETIHQLQQVYGSLIVPVAIHSDYLGIHEPEGLANDLGNTYFDALTFQPKVKAAVQVSRYYGEVLTSNTNITFYTDNVVPIPTQLDIRLKATQQSADHTKADVDVKVICTDAEAAITGRLQVWVTEDSIIATQKYLGGIVYSDYVHNHVLRAAVNGTWGEDVSIAGLADEREFHYTVQLQPNWQPRHLAIVAFVYNDDEVVQAARGAINIKQ